MGDTLNETIEELFSAHEIDIDYDGYCCGVGIKVTCKCGEYVDRWDVQDHLKEVLKEAFR